MPQVDLIHQVHNRTKRNYLERVVEHDKAECAAIAKQFGKDFWDGDRKYGYGGYRYDGRWRNVAEKLVEHYDLKRGDRVLDVGCGKGFLLFEFTQLVPGIEIVGIDISEYAIEHAKPEVKPCLRVADAVELPFDDQSFDFVVSINTLHNLYNFDLRRALGEMERVGRKKYTIVDSYRNEREKVNLMYWQLTCECFYTPREWEWFFQESGYTGDYGFTFFE
ncbi:MAG: class I SAM-dependent methyltransferase [Gemmataceae bacterium]|nr:class I SAM-dependent methyltransferase [Gemmataceae bacterium]